MNYTGPGKDRPHPSGAYLLRGLSLPCKLPAVPFEITLVAFKMDIQSRGIWLIKYNRVDPGNIGETAENIHAALPLEAPGTVCPEKSDESFRPFPGEGFQAENPACSSKKNGRRFPVKLSKERDRAGIRTKGQRYRGETEEGFLQLFLPAAEECEIARRTENVFPGGTVDFSFNKRNENGPDFVSQVGRVLVGGILPPGKAIPAEKLTEVIPGILQERTENEAPFLRDARKSPNACSTKQVVQKGFR